VSVPLDDDAHETLDIGLEPDIRDDTVGRVAVGP